MTQTKICGRCHQTLELVNFTKSKKASDGYFCYCRKCQVEYNRQYRTRVMLNDPMVKCACGKEYRTRLGHFTSCPQCRRKEYQKNYRCKMSKTESCLREEPQEMYVPNMFTYDGIKDAIRHGISSNILSREDCDKFWDELLNKRQ